MAWLFERMIELAAWIAFILGIAFLCESIYLLLNWVRSLGGDEPAGALLLQSAQAAGAFVLSALSMGALACIDRYVFDLPETPVRK
ncbi:MAG TPA: hypothetical protein VEQ85_10510 [Lacipirellulaceae bacterium]|nr:hypothetical protein [Lacipirellulaceae bacterium]